MSDVTRILNAIEQGDEKATDELLPLIYEELHHRHSSTGAIDRELDMNMSGNLSTPTVPSVLVNRQ